MKLLFVFFCSFSFFFSQGIVYSQRSPQRQQPVTINNPITVAEASRLPVGSWVILTGYIVSSLPGGKHYTFRDSSGEITVEIEWDIWRGLSAGPQDRVTIYGDIESRRGRPYIEVEAITGSGRMNTRQGQAVTIIQPITVEEVKNLPADSWVTLSGYITQMLQNEIYLFTDSTGEITVEIEQDVWRGLSVGPQDRVEISGELEIKRRQVTIDVKVIRRAAVTQ